MPKVTYEVTYIVVTDNDGLISHKLKGIKQMSPIPEEDFNEDNNT